MISSEEHCVSGVVVSDRVLPTPSNGPLTPHTSTPTTCAATSPTAEPRRTSRTSAEPPCGRQTTSPGASPPTPRRDGNTAASRSAVSHLIIKCFRLKETGSMTLKMFSLIRDLNILHDIYSCNIIVTV